VLALASVVAADTMKSRRERPGPARPVRFSLSAVFIGGSLLVTRSGPRCDAGAISREME